MILAVVGSREFPNEAMVRQWTSENAHRFTNFVSGGAKGPDSWALEEWLKVHGAGTYKVHKADWDRYGKGAGFIRNIKIIRDADFVACFWTAQTNGTLDDLGLLFNCGTPYNLYVR